MIPRRIQRRRVKGFRCPPNTIYVGRPSKWGNPYTIVTIIEDRLFDVTTPEEAVRRYRETPAASQLRDAARLELRGKHLSCWCPLTQPCHADVLLKWANERPAL